MARILFDAEIGSFEQLLDQDDLRTAARSLADQSFCGSDIGIDVPAACELRGSDRHLAFWTMEMRGNVHANTLPGLRIPFGSSACLSSRMVDISAALRDRGR